MRFNDFGCKIYVLNSIDFIVFCLVLLGGIMRKKFFYRSIICALLFAQLLLLTGCYTQVPGAIHDKDKIADEQAKLYKKEKYNAFVSLIPLAIQIILLLI